MLTCKKLVENGSEYLEGELSGWQRFKFKFHMFMCVHCKRYISQLSYTIKMIGKSSDLVPNKKLKDSICNEYQKLMEIKSQKPD